MLTIHRDFQQGSLEWDQMRCGKVTMSRAKDLVASRGKGVGRKSYILQCVAEALSGQSADGFTSYDMERGTFMEPHALQAFSNHTGHKLDTVGFVQNHHDLIGCSPDALIGDNAGVEVKSPKPYQHLRNCFESGVNDYYAQIQGNMWVCERDYFFFVSFCPDVEQYPLHVELVERDEEFIGRLAESAIDAAEEVAGMVARIKANHVQHDVATVAAKAREAWENVFAAEVTL